jgi:hypothetical protein
MINSNIIALRAFVESLETHDINAKNAILEALDAFQDSGEAEKTPIGTLFDRLNSNEMEGNIGGEDYLDIICDRVRPLIGDEVLENVVEVQLIVKNNISTNHYLLRRDRFEARKSFDL